ncbi:MAG TPA: 4-hydroxy-tetrahydrodipicolinate synthase [Xanthobacteraceae bacterium]|jgi:4-hydroxy-tetrahydrodipicolinate synthase
MTTIGRHVSNLSGYAPAVPTPFGPDDAIDGAAFERFCARQVAKGATALVVCGTTGEAPTLTSAEHREVIRIAAAVARGQVPVIAGAGSNATAHAVELSRDAEAAGADAILSVAPYYNKPTQAGIEAHFRAIAGATRLPLFLYDVPSRTISGLADDTVARLAELPQIIGLKDATGDITRPARLRPRLGSDFRLLSGDDATAPAYLAQGGDGCISVTSNVAPSLCRMLYLQRRNSHAIHVQWLVQLHARLTAALFRESNPAPVKYALSLLGLMSARLRLPLVEPTQATRADVRAAMAAIDDGYSDYLIESADALTARVHAAQ